MTRDERGELMWQIVQCAVATAIGCAIFYAMRDEPNDRARLFGALIGGIGGSYYLTKFYVWVRYGRKAAKSMSWEP